MVPGVGFAPTHPEMAALQAVEPFVLDLLSPGAPKRDSHVLYGFCFGGPGGDRTRVSSVRNWRSPVDPRAHEGAMDGHGLIRLGTRDPQPAAPNDILEAIGVHGILLPGARPSSDVPQGAARGGFQSASYQAHEVPTDGSLRILQGGALFEAPAGFWWRQGESNSRLERAALP